MQHLSTAARRIAAITLVIAVTTLAAWHITPAPLPPLRVVKSPGCACCAKWVAYMKQQGFAVTVEDSADFTDLKRASGVTRELESCHTAFVGGYVIEGHVPADLVKKLLAEKPRGSQRPRRPRYALERARDGHARAALHDLLIRCRRTHQGLRTALIGRRRRAQS